MNYAKPSRLFEGSSFAIATVTELLAARAASAAAGNRRSLFARMDAILALDHVPDLGDSVVPAPIAIGGDAVRLARLRLRNWKSFERADLVFPVPREGRSMIVVGGPNGFGKSSLLEAYAFALFGRRALTDIGFLISGTGKKSDQRRSYLSLMERNLHRSERARDDGIASVVLDFETDEGSVSIERKWYFDEGGALIEEDEELLVRTGGDGNPLPVPDGVTARDWYQQEIERRVMPADLAPFFLFDGEQVERWADRKLSDQVRSAMTRMLGLSELRGLADDLRDFARDRERGLGEADQGSMDGLRDEVTAIAQTLNIATFELEAIDKELCTLRTERDRLLQIVAETGGISHADVQADLERQHRLTAERKRLAREFIAVLADEGPLLLAGTGLISRTRSEILTDISADHVALQPEEVTVLWERFLAAGPPLDEEQQTGLKSRFEAACVPSAEQMAGPGAHGHLDRKARRAVIAKLGTGISRGRARVIEAARILEELDTRLQHGARIALKLEADVARAVEAQSSLSGIGNRIENRAQERHNVARKLEDLKSAYEPKLRLIEQHERLRVEAEPRLRALSAARSLAAALEEQAARAADAEHGRFAAAVTKCFKALAHKDQIARIEIYADGELRLFDSQDRDVTDYRLSAGESQLFAMALIAAVGDLVGDRLPLVVDTPLGRLDTKHRRSVLDMLSRRRSQTILLTQPEELTPEHLERVQSKLAGLVRLEHVIDDRSNVGVSHMVVDDVVEAA